MKRGGRCSWRCDRITCGADWMNGGQSKLVNEYIRFKLTISGVGFLLDLVEWLSVRRVL